MAKVLQACFGVGLLAALVPCAGRAQGEFQIEFQAHLEAGRHADAAALAQAAGGQSGAEGEAGFALGTAQFLDAVGNLMRGLYRHGLRSEERSGDFGGMIQLPFLRLPVPDNPAPEPVTYAALNGLLADFVDDLAMSEATLAKVGDAPFTLKIDLARVGFDIDGDGAVGDLEELASIVEAVSGVRELSFDPAGFTVGFDQSDAPWLMGYSHLLSALAEVPLAYDWSGAYEMTFHSLFDGIDTASSNIAVEEARLIDLIMARDWSVGPPRWNGQGDYTEYLRIRREWEATPEGKIWRQQQDAGMALQYGSVADIVAFIHLFNWPVAEPERMQSARQHLLSMVALSRENWRRIRAETDDELEWVPGPHQTNVINRLRVDEGRVEGWMQFLDEFEAILEGRKLVPHWRFVGDRGVNLRRMFDQPTTLDPVLIGQGTAVLPYLEEGELVDSRTFWTIMEMMEGGLLAYFIWFN